MSAPLESFFVALANGEQPRSIPRELSEIAGTILRRSMGHFGPRDLAAEFLLRVIVATQKDTAGSAKHLRVLAEPQLKSIVRFRMQQIVADHSDARRATKQLREGVRRALARELPSPETAPPSSLLIGNRLAAKPLALAVAFVLSLSDAPARDDISAIADRLRAMYLHVAVWDEAVPDDDPSVLFEARERASRIRSAVSADDLDTVRRRLRDQTFAQIANDKEIAVATAHRRYEVSMNTVKAICSESDSEPRVVSEVLNLLAA